MPDAPPHTWQGRGIVKGRASGPALISNAPFSFLGDVDIRSGIVAESQKIIAGKSLAGQVLVISTTTGSAGAWRFLYQLKMHNTHPVALITQDLPDASVVQGAILADIPIISGIASQIAKCSSGNWVIDVDGHSGVALATQFSISAGQ